MTNNGLPSPQEKGTQALVIGGGIAGLLAARVLSEHYDQVQIVERDALPEKPEYRAGTPQSFHLHRLLSRGKVTLERLFPNLVSELLERGAASTAQGKLWIVNSFGEFSIRYPTKEASCSRYLLEWTLRQRVQALSNVHFSTGLEVIGLQTNPERTRIMGVHVRQRGSLQQSSIAADLVIDTSGRTTKLPQWLQDLGYDVPGPERIKTDLGYSTRYYRASTRLANECWGIYAEGQPARRIRTAYAFLMEDNLWCVVLFGAGGYYPATDNDGFDQELRQTTSLTLAETVQAETEPITSPRGYRIAECLRHHFDQMKRWPSGLLVMGDAFCNLDPIYGHGMTVAALEAETLARCLNEQRSHPSPSFELRTLTSLQEAIQPAWWISAIADLRWPNVTYRGQEPPKGVTLIQRYLNLYLQVAMKRMEEQPPDNSYGAPTPDLFSPQPSLAAYMQTNLLTLSPRVVFNVTTYRLLLEMEAAQQGPLLLQELTEDYHLSLEEILSKVLPTFSLPFLSPPTEHAAD